MNAKVFWSPRLEGALLCVLVESESRADSASKAHEVAAALWREGVASYALVDVQGRYDGDPTAIVSLWLVDHADSQEVKQHVEAILSRVVGG